MIMAKVICNSRHGCAEAAMGCGGATPHHECTECGKCPFDGDARCVEAKINDYPTRGAR